MTTLDGGKKKRLKIDTFKKYELRKWDLCGKKLEFGCAEWNPTEADIVVNGQTVDWSSGAANLGQLEYVKLIKIWKLYLEEKLLIVQGFSHAILVLTVNSIQILKSVNSNFTLAVHGYTF